MSSAASTSRCSGTRAPGTSITRPGFARSIRPMGPFSGPRTSTTAAPPSARSRDQRKHLSSHVRRKTLRPRSHHRRHPRNRRPRRQRARSTASARLNFYTGMCGPPMDCSPCRWCQPGRPFPSRANDRRNGRRNPSGIALRPWPTACTSHVSSGRLRLPIGGRRHCPIATRCSGPARHDGSRDSRVGGPAGRPGPCRPGH